MRHDVIWQHSPCDYRALQPRAAGSSSPLCWTMESGLLFLGLSQREESALQWRRPFPTSGLPRTQIQSDNSSFTSSVMTDTFWSHCSLPPTVSTHNISSIETRVRKTKKRLEFFFFLLSPNARSITTIVHSHRGEEKTRDEQISDRRRSSRPNCTNVRWHWRPGPLQNKNAQLIYLPGQTFRERAVTTRTDGRRAGDEGGETKDN